MNFLSSKKNIFLVLVVVAGVVWGSYHFLKNKEPIEFEGVLVENNNHEYSVIGKSVEDREITSYSFGNGKTNILFVGGIHGGYEWNSTLLAYDFIDYFTENPDSVPENVTLKIIPSANPDGLFKVVGKNGRFLVSDVSFSKNILEEGRLNANGVDLNRNFDCNWQPESKWKSNVVSAGTESFSEPETETIKNFVEDLDPKAVVFWHSQANAVYASECNEGPLPETIKIMNEYSSASGYKAVPSFDAYEITGDAEGWLASIGVPAITVELETRESIDWEKNLFGVKGILKYFGQK